MSKKLFENIKENLKPRKSLIDDTKAKIFKNNMHTKNRISYNKKIAFVASFVLILAVCIPTLLRNSSFLNQKEPSDVSNSSISNTSEMKGVVVVAYSPKMSGQTITANYINETLPVKMKPDVSVLLPSYSPVMSSVPGFPFEFKTMMTDGTSTSDYDMEISVDNGSLISWNINTGEIIDNAKLYKGKSKATLYWSPLNEQEIVENAQILVKIYKNKEIICSQTITITQENQIFYATIN